MPKADFDSIYTAKSPLPYYTTLGELDYQIPDHGSAVFTQLADYLQEQHQSDTLRIADLCCSYGVNAAVMKHDVTFQQIAEHYANVDDGALPEFIERDRRWFESRVERDDFEFVGIDTSSEAIAYATDAGLLDGGAAENLEVNDPSKQLASEIEDVQLVTVTGGIGYITDATINRVLAATNTTPWVAALCLRWVDFEPIAEAGAERGLVTERLDDVTFPQRRFLDADEQRFVLDELNDLGIDPAGREADGYHHSDLYVMRPAQSVTAYPLDALIANDASGSLPSDDGLI